jgi:hypothetical protein
MKDLSTLLNSSVYLDYCHSMRRIISRVHRHGVADTIPQELAKVQVIDGGKLVPKKRKITLRMLLAHTGTSYILKYTRSFVAYTNFSQLASDILSSTHALTISTDRLAWMNSRVCPMTTSASLSSTNPANNGNTASISTGLDSLLSASADYGWVTTSKNTSSNQWVLRTSTCFPQKA